MFPDRRNHVAEKEAISHPLAASALPCIQTTASRLDVLAHRYRLSTMNVDIVFPDVRAQSPSTMPRKDRLSPQIVRHPLHGVPCMQS